MPIPIPALAGLLIGGGFGAGKISDHMRAKREMEAELAEQQRLTEKRANIGNMIRTITSGLNAQNQPPQMVPIEGATQATQAPTAQPAQPVAQPAQAELATTGEPEPTMEELGPSPLRPGEITDLPILPTKNLAGSGQFSLQGATVDESGNVSFQIKKDQSQIGAQWFQMFQNSRNRMARLNPKASPLQLDDEAVADAIRRSGMLPPQQALTMLDPARREKVSEQTYWSAVYHLSNNREVKQALSLMSRGGGHKLSANALDSATLHYALRSVANDMGGFMPEDVREKLLNLEGPPVSPEIMQEVYRLYGATRPEQVTNAMSAKAQQSLQEKRISEHHDKAVAGALAAEMAQKQIHQQEFGGGAGPVGREADKRQALAATAPIDPKTRAQAGIPPDFNTYLDVVKGGFRLMSPKDQDTYKSLRQVQTLIDKITELVPRIFTSDSSWGGRAAHGASLLSEKIQGTPLGDDVNLYMSKRISMTKLLNQLAGEPGSRFSDQDAERIMETIPNITTGVPEGKRLADQKMIDLQEQLMSLTTALETPQMIKMQQSKTGGKFKITKDGKVEKK